MNVGGGGKPGISSSHVGSQMGTSPMVKLHEIIIWKCHTQTLSVAKLILC